MRTFFSGRLENTANADKESVESPDPGARSRNDVTRPRDLPVLAVLTYEEVAVFDLTILRSSARRYGDRKKSHRHQKPPKQE